MHRISEILMAIRRPEAGHFQLLLAMAMVDSYLPLSVCHWVICPCGILAWLN
ncbi:hypothetical protein BDV32DRAFT_127222 [Aspergillus pseudonomiae]|nr:hypothetical protein BDV32DRAFT_127222 [Aspergillus pseudonomiae]